MIYNLVEYLKVNLPALNYICNGWIDDTEISETSINITQTGGEPDHFFSRTDWNIQIMSRAKVNTLAKTNIDNVYNKLKNRYGLTLPEITVDDIVYPEIKTSQIVPLQVPEYIGLDEKKIKYVGIQYQNNHNIMEDKLWQ